jgi:hypothetical protein
MAIPTASILRRSGGFPMKDAYEVLRQTELRVVQIRKEIDALLVVAPLLKDESDRLSEEESREFAIRA